MIIAHLARATYPFHPYGGLEQHVYHLTVELARLGHEVHLFTQPPDPNYGEGFSWPEGVRHHYLPYHYLKFLRRNSIPDRLANYPVFSLKLANALKKLQPAPQIVHAHGLAAFGYAMNPLSDVPLVLNPHGMEEFKNKSPLKQLAYSPFRTMLRAAARRSTAIIATDQSLISEISSHLKTPPDKTCLIPNAVDLEEIDRKLSEAIAPETTGFLILSVGRLEENKGYNIGLEALALLQKEGRLPENWRWVLVGDGSQKEALKTQVSRLGLAGKVLFPGSLPDRALYGYYRVADLFLHPTLFEGSALVVLEALACKIPVVGSRTGGLPDKIIESGPTENGRLTEPGNPAGLAAKLNEMLSLSTEIRSKLGANGRQMVEQEFSWKSAAKACESLYHKLKK